MQNPVIVFELVFNASDLHNFQCASTNRREYDRCCDNYLATVERITKGDFQYLGGGLTSVCLLEHRGPNERIPQMERAGP